MALPLSETLFLTSVPSPLSDNDNINYNNDTNNQEPISSSPLARSQKKKKSRNKNRNKNRNKRLRLRQKLLGIIQVSVFYKIVLISSFHAHPSIHIVSFYPHLLCFVFSCPFHDREELSHKCLRIGNPSQRNPLNTY